LYTINECYRFLDSTTDLTSLSEIAKCGKTGAQRILLFLYIYKIITNKYGCDMGYIAKSILYYLNTPNTIQNSPLIEN
jgi:hypothetical protein